MNDGELDPMPDPVIEEKEPNPGGADALPDDASDDGLARDLDPAANPAVDETVPDEIAEADDKSQAPDEEEEEEEEEPPA